MTTPRPPPGGEGIKGKGLPFDSMTTLLNFALAGLLYFALAGALEEEGPGKGGERRQTQGKGRTRRRRRRRRRRTEQPIPHADRSADFLGDPQVCRTSAAWGRAPRPWRAPVLRGSGASGSFGALRCTAPSPPPRGFRTLLALPGAREAPRASGDPRGPPQVPGGARPRGDASSPGSLVASWCSGGQ